MKIEANLLSNVEPVEYLGALLSQEVQRVRLHLGLQLLDLKLVVLPQELHLVLHLRVDLPVRPHRHLAPLTVLQRFASLELAPQATVCHCVCAMEGWLGLCLHS